MSLKVSKSIFNDIFLFINLSNIALCRNKILDELIKTKKRFFKFKF